MSFLLRIWEWEGAARSLFRAVPLMNQIKKCVSKTREDFIHNSQTKPQFVSYIITGDEYWKCQYDPQTHFEIMACRIIASMKTKIFIWKSRGSNLCSSLYFWWAGCNTQKMCAWSKNSQEWGYIQAMEMSVERILGVRPKLLEK